MSPPPTPTNLRVLRGNPGKRTLKPEPQPRVPGQLPPPPDWLNQAATDEYYRISEELLYLGLLTSADINPLIAYCAAYGRWVDAERTLKAMADRDTVTHGLMVKGSLGNPVQNPIAKIADRAAVNMVRFASEFGLSPAARTRIAAGVDPDSNIPDKFAGLLA